MRALVQRVASARVTVTDEGAGEGAGEVTGAVEHGLLVLLGVTDDDDTAVAEKLARKVRRLRVFEDDAGKMNLDLEQVGGAVLAVSQFTLYGDCSAGNRPSFVKAARPERAEPLYRHFCEALRRSGVRVAEGRFGAAMDVELVNRGPVTLWLDSAEL